MILFGLRIQIFPNIQTVNESCKSKWEENLTQCSSGMLKMLQVHYTEELEKIGKEIIEIQTKLLPHIESDIYKNNLLKLEKFIEIHKRDLIKGKEKQFQRDATGIAFATGKAYKWEKSDNTYTITFNLSQTGCRQ